MVGIGAGLPVEGMVALYIHRKGEPHKLAVIYWKAEGFLIEKVSPAAYGLSQRNDYSCKVSGSNKTLFAVSADKISYQKTKNKSAVNGKSAASHVKYF